MPDVKKLDMHVFVNLNPNAPAGPDEQLGDSHRADGAVLKKASWWPWDRERPRQPDTQRQTAVPARPSPDQTAPGKLCPGNPRPARRAGRTAPVQRVAQAVAATIRTPSFPRSTSPRTKS